MMDQEISGVAVQNEPAQKAVEKPQILRKAKEVLDGRQHKKPMREYRTWCRMRKRCSNPRSHVYALYGGRGIKVCERWMKFKNFLADMGRSPSLKHSLDRINVNGDYEPSNCRWATQKEQCRNKRDNRLITIGGITRCAVEWEEIVGMGPGAIVKRIDRGWKECDLLAKPKVRPNKKGDRRPHSSKRAKLQFIHKAGCPRRHWSMNLDECTCGANPKQASKVPA